jgi:hypothetical protein
MPPWIIGWGTSIFLIFSNGSFNKSPLSGRVDPTGEQLNEVEKGHGYGHFPYSRKYLEKYRPDDPPVMFLSDLFENS